MENNVEMVTIHVMGKKHRVPNDLTIMKAMEYAGHQFRRGSGCRGGYCGACATLYRVKGSYKLEGALACQKIVEEDMYIAQIPFNPAEKITYDIEKVRPDANTMLEYYPELSRCLSCNTCTKACPQDIMVMDYVQASLRGDIIQAAKLSFDCLTCGLCAVRCPAEIVPYNAATLARRMYAKYIDGPSKHVIERAAAVEAGEYDEGIKELMEMDKEPLQERYENRDVNIHG
jgi:heterodisulfide reductase subunit C